MSDSVYNPLDKNNLGKSVAQALLERGAVALGQLPAFKGAGVYAIYYAGAFAAYEQMARFNRGVDPKAPIYVGKAIPQGARKGGEAAGNTQSQALFKRLQEHAKSIDACENLALSDFTCRYLAVDDIWIPLGESLLISTFAPLWNLVLDGFGNHDPGAGRHAGLVPRWDVLHPGRSWAAKCKPRPETATQIERDVVAHLQAAPSLVRLRSMAANGSDIETEAGSSSTQASGQARMKKPKA
jgi:Eco29kI restriction endonuclease